MNIWANEQHAYNNRVFKMARILDISVKVPKLAHYTEKQLVEFYATDPKLKEKIEKAYEEDAYMLTQRGVNTPKVLEVEPVLPKKSKWVHGEYYAHEYDEYVDGRMRKVDYMKYRNGKATKLHTEYEVQCLDDTKKVLDGMWEDERGNGFGDYFEPLEETPWQ